MIIALFHLQSDSQTSACIQKVFEFPLNVFGRGTNKGFSKLSMEFEDTTQWSFSATPPPPVLSLDAFASKYFSMILSQDTVLSDLCDVEFVVGEEGASERILAIGAIVAMRSPVLG